MKKRLLSLFLCLCMLLTLLPNAVFAGQNESLSTTAQRTDEMTTNPFADVNVSDWFYSAVQYARERSIFSGTSAATFEPNGAMTRGMFVTVLGRMAGVDTAGYKGESAFTDVAADAYYAPYVAWAAKHGITSGAAESSFAPQELINRQQMAVFFVRYFEHFGVDYDTGAHIITAPADMDTVADYAKDAVMKLWKAGLLAGDGTNFHPLDNASRAQAATLCMRTDGAVKTWYKEPGVPKEKTPVVTPPSSGSEPAGGSPSGGSPSGGGSSGDGSSGDTPTVYYEVTLNTGEESIKKLYPAGTLLSTLPIPAQESGTVFLGWYYDSALGNMVTSTDTLGRNLTLHAKFSETVSLTETGELNFVTKQDVAADFSIPLSADHMPVSGADFSFRNITDPSVTDGTDGVQQETIAVTGSAGSYTVTSAAIDGFTPGHTYQIELLHDDITFAGEREEIRYYNFIIQKDEVLNLTLNNGIRYIAASALSETDRQNVLEYAGLYQAATDAQGVTTYTANSGAGSFTYSGGGILAGDTIAVYTGKKPDQRAVGDSGAVAYLEITRIDGTTYYYESAKSEDVLFTPDLLPIDLDAGDGVTVGNTVASSGTGSITIETGKLNFSAALYADMGLGTDTVVEPGDFLSFFGNGDFGDETASKQGYGVITNVTVNGGSTIITYTVVDEADVLSAMELYSESELTDEEIEAAYDEQLIRETVESQLLSGGFIQEAGKVLAGLAIQTDEIKEIFGSEDNLTLSDYTIAYSDGTPVHADDLVLMGNIVNKEGGVKTSVSVTPRLSHFEGKKGVRVEVAVTYKFDIKKSGSDKKVEVELTAFFEQEVLFGFSVSGGAVWKKKWIFPYIADYRMTGNIDLGTYTGVGITATAKLDEEDEPWGMPWPNNAKEAAATKKIFSLSESIKKMVEDVETVFPESEASSSGGLAGKYAAFMEDANDAWVDLFVVNLIDLRGGVDPLHILAYGIQVDFVVSANLNVAVGMTFQYENSKRHSFVLTLKSKQANSETIDLSTNGYQFDFYVMGSMGIRAGVRAKALVGLFSTKLDGIGLQIEAGAYARLWGYFYYSLTNYKINGVWVKNSSSSGAMLVEIGTYLDVNFVAEVLNGKYSYAPSIYAKEWPLWSAGQRENVYDFAYEDTPAYTIQNVTTYTLPNAVFEMKWMDLKTGDIGEDDKPNTKNFDANTVHSTDDEKYFAVELSNPAFTYNPVNNKITVSRASGDSTLTSEMKVTWKGAPLAFSTETLSRTITLKWSDLANGKTIVFDSKDGSPVDMICKLAGANISFLKPANPARAGYTFAGWYTNEAYTGTAYSIPDTMPSQNVTLYAKWTPNMASYTVEHYKEGLDGMYVLEERQTLSGMTNQATDAQVKSYAGFTHKAIQQKTIQADGNTVVQVYYERNHYTVTFQYGAEAGNRSVAVKYPVGAKIEWSSPAVSGYSFLRWDNVIPAVMPAQSLTFTAVWEARPDIRYTVEHYQEGLTRGAYILAETEVKTGSSNANVSPETKSYTGFTAPSAQPVTIKGDGSTVVKYYYTRSMNTLTYALGNGEEDAVFTIKFGDSIVQQPDPARAGYTFAGWTLNGNAYTFSTMPAENIILTAAWTADSSIAYTVEHFKEELDGSYPAAPGETENLNGTMGATVYAAAKSYTGFTYEPNVGGTVSSGTVTADGSLVLKVYYTRNSYNVAWDGNGGTVDNTGATYGSVKYGAPITNPTHNPTKAGYTFHQWSGYTANMIMPAANTTFTAGWTANEYTVTFDSNGGNEVASITKAYGTAVTAPAAPTKENYTFAGWQLNGTNYVFTTMPAENITLVAVWSAIPAYTVSFEANGGTIDTASKSVIVNGTYGDLPVPAYPGHYFLGWFTATSGGTKVTSTTHVELSVDHTLYARWATIGYTGEVSEKVVLYVAGIKVTTENMNDILGDGSASVQFDPSTTTTYEGGYINHVGTLYLNNATIAGTYSSSYLSAAIYSEGSLGIVNTGTSTVTNTTYSAAVSNVFGIYTNSALVIEGTGTLSVTSGTGGTYMNSGIRVGAGGNYFTINGPAVRAFGGVAGSGGKSYGVCVGILDYVYTVILKKGTLETRGYDYAAYCGPRDSTVKYFVTNGSTKIANITVSTSYDGTSPASVPQNETYQDYKYITVTNP
jgi:uncharacterized repeat protein (TIGR02543 family)